MKKIISKILISLILFVTIFSNSSFNITPVQASPVQYFDQWRSLHPDPNGDKQLSELYGYDANNCFIQAISVDSALGANIDRNITFIQSLNLSNYWTRSVDQTVNLDPTDPNYDKSGKWGVILALYGAGYENETNFLMNFEINLLNGPKRIWYFEPTKSTTFWQNLSGAVQSGLRGITNNSNADDWNDPGATLMAYSTVTAKDKYQMIPATLNRLYSSEGPLFEFAQDNRFLEYFTDKEVEKLTNTAQLEFGSFIIFLQAGLEAQPYLDQMLAFTSAKADAVAQSKLLLKAKMMGEIARMRAAANNVNKTLMLNSAGGTDTAALVAKNGEKTADALSNNFGEGALRRLQATNISIPRTAAAKLSERQAEGVELKFIDQVTSDFTTMDNLWGLSDLMKSNRVEGSYAELAKSYYDLTSFVYWIGGSEEAEAFINYFAGKKLPNIIAFNFNEFPAYSNYIDQARYSNGLKILAELRVAHEVGGESLSLLFGGRPRIFIGGIGETIPAPLQEGFFDWNAISSVSKRYSINEVIAVYKKNGSRWYDIAQELVQLDSKVRGIPYGDDLRIWMRANLNMHDPSIPASTAPALKLQVDRLNWVLLPGEPQNMWMKLNYFLIENDFDGASEYLSTLLKNWEATHK